MYSMTFGKIRSARLMVRLVVDHGMNIILYTPCGYMYTYMFLYFGRDGYMICTTVYNVYTCSISHSA